MASSEGLGKPCMPTADAADQTEAAADPDSSGYVQSIQMGQKCPTGTELSTQAN